MPPDTCPFETLASGFVFWSSSNDIAGAIYALMLSRLLRDFRLLAVVFIL